MEKEKRKKNPLMVTIHHIKSPIFVLKSYLETIISGDLGNLNDAQEKYIKVCLENTKKISSIVEDLVCLMEIEEGVWEIKKEKVNIVDVIKKSTENNKFLLRAGNTKVFSEFEEDEIFVCGDFDKLVQICDAFIANGIKYKKSGEGVIEISVKKEGEKIICSIKDNGVGIDEEEKEKIFKKFYRTQKAIEIDPNSLGIELYVTKKIIENLGGEIWVESNNNGGATFSFSLLSCENN